MSLSRPLFYSEAYDFVLLSHIHAAQNFITIYPIHLHRNVHGTHPVKAFPATIISRKYLEASEQVFRYEAQVKLAKAAQFNLCMRYEARK